jgi:hypothetical protein
MATEREDLALVWRASSTPTLRRASIFVIIKCVISNNVVTGTSGDGAGLFVSKLCRLSKRLGREHPVRSEPRRNARCGADGFGGYMTFVNCAFVRIARTALEALSIRSLGRGRFLPTAVSSPTPPRCWILVL